MSGSTSAVQRGENTLCTVPTMCVSSWESVRSPMRALDSSNNRSDSSVRRSASNPRAAQFGNQLGDDQDDHHVDGQRDQILGRAHCQGVVRREEEPVVDDEARQRTHDARREAADGRADDGGHHQDERGHRDAQVGAKRQQQAQECRQAGQGDDNSDKIVLVRSPGNQLAWRHVCHGFLSIGASAECTDAVARAAEG